MSDKCFYSLSLSDIFTNQLANAFKTILQAKPNKDQRKCSNVYGKLKTF